MAVVVVGVFFSDIPKAYADTCTWSSGTTASTAVWSNCSGGAPGADDAAIINTGSSSITWDITSVGSITLDTGFSGNVTTSVNITVVTTSGGTGDMAINAGTFTQHNAITINGGDLTVASGAVYTYTLSPTLTFQTGTSATGIGGAGSMTLYQLRIVSGSIKQAGNVTAQAGGFTMQPGNAFADATYDMNGYNLTVTGSFSVGFIFNPGARRLIYDFLRVAGFLT